MNRVAAMVVAVNLLIWWFFVHNRTLDQLQYGQQDVTLKAARAAMSLPAIVNFQERKMLKHILETRDRAVATTTYVVDLNGHPRKICGSVGYGLSYSTQLTNPSQNPSRTVVLSQAEPNGLFSPPGTEGTWVSCVDPISNDTQIVYVEPPVIVSPFPLSVD